MAGGLPLTGRGAARRPPRPPAAAWWALCALAGAGALLTALAGEPAALRWQPERAWTQPWRWWTAAWVHLSTLHLVANLAGTALVAALGPAAGCGRRAALAWAAAWPLTHGALLAQPALAFYGGLSGVLHAAVAVAAVQLLRGPAPAGPAAGCDADRPVGPVAAPAADRAAGPGLPPGRRRAVGALLAAGLAAKLLLEAPWAGPLRHAPGWDIAIAPLAHAAGALAGALCALACGVGSDAERRAGRQG